MRTPALREPCFHTRAQQEQTSCHLLLSSLQRLEKEEDGGESRRPHAHQCRYLSQQENLRRDRTELVLDKNCGSPVALWVTRVIVLGLVVPGRRPRTYSSCSPIESVETI
jgi:hypothetical protein